MGSMLETLDRKPRGGAGAGRRGVPRGRLTERDLDVVRWLGLVWFATGEQVGGRLSVGRLQRCHPEGRS